MKNLVKVAKVAFIGYCAYKLIDAAVDNRKKTKQPEEYIPFDEIPVVEDKNTNNDMLKKVIIVSGVAIYATIQLQLNALLRMCNINMVSNIVNMDEDITVKINMLENFRDRIFDKNSKYYIDRIITLLEEEM